METYNAAEFREVMAWLHGGDTTPDPKMEEKFLEIVADRVMVKMGIKVSEEERARHEEAMRRRERRRDGFPHPLSIKALMEQIRQEDQNEVTATPIPVQLDSDTVASSTDDLPWETKSKDSELDSVVVAKALQWMASMHDVQLNGSQIQSILYNAYGVWLARKGARLLCEHPQVWQYGPVFPRAYKHLKKNVGTGEVEYEMLMNDHPDEFVFISKCFKRFAWTSAATLSCPHTADGSPWKSTLDKNSSKLGVRIEDELVREWFSPRV